MIRIPKERFQKFIMHEPNTGCWFWTGGIRGKSGYGAFTIEAKTKYAHRLSYEFYVGKIPVGLIVRHECDNKICVNPDHLRIGTHQDNSNDAIKRNRFNAIKPNKLTVISVQVIREAILSGFKQKDIAKYFGINPSSISAINCGRNWKKLK